MAEEIYRPKYETIAQSILEFIKVSELKPGDRLPTEQRLAQQLGVTRAMVREAIRLLMASGHVRTRRGSGTYVDDGRSSFAMEAISLSMPVDLDHALKLYEFRSVQEVATAILAAERITPRELLSLEEAMKHNLDAAAKAQWDIFTDSDISFHHIIAKASRNSFLEETVTATFRLQVRAIKLIVPRSLGSFLKAAEEHAAIASAIRRGVPDAAGEAMRIHIQGTKTNFLLEVNQLINSHENSSY